VSSAGGYRSFLFWLLLLFREHFAMQKRYPCFERD
jgi:hypothetical protein